MVKSLSDNVVEAFFAVHRTLGPGLPEACYEEALTREFEEMGIPFQRQKRFEVSYKGKVLAKSFRVDLLVDDQIIVEVKSIADLLPVHHAQVIGYLRASDKQLGYLVNFNSHLIKKAIHRKVDNFEGYEDEGDE